MKGLNQIWVRRRVHQRLHGEDHRLHFYRRLEAVRL